MTAVQRFNLIYNLGSNLLRANYETRTPNLFSLICKRGIRGQRKIFRTHLPKYKNNLFDLPALTKLLTMSDEPTNLEEAINVRKEKLEVYKNYIPINSNTNLIEALLHPDNDIDRLLKIIDENLETMNSFHIAVSFEALDDFMRANLCDKSTVAVSPEFKKLSTKTLYKLRFFESDEVLKLIKCLSTLKVPESTLLVQGALQMARHFINDFNLDELETISGALDAFEVQEGNDKSLLVTLKKAISLAQKKQPTYCLPLKS